MDLGTTILCCGTKFIGQYYCTLLHNKVRLALHCKQPELQQHGVILLQDCATPHHHHDVQNLVQLWGLGGVDTSSLLSSSHPM